MSKIVGSNLDNEYPLASHRPARTVKRELTQTKQVKTKDEMMKTGVREKNNPDVYGGALIENNIKANLIVSRKPARGHALSAIKLKSGLVNVPEAPLRHPFKEEKDFGIIPNQPLKNVTQKPESKDTLTSFPSPEDQEAFLNRDKDSVKTYGPQNRDVRRAYPKDGPKEGIPINPNFPTINPYVADHALLGNVLTHEECDQILEWKNDTVNFHMHPATIAGTSGDEKFVKQKGAYTEEYLKETGYSSSEEYDKNYRVCNMWMDRRATEEQAEIKDPIMNKIIGAVIDFNNRHFKFDIGGVLSPEWPTLIEYNVGGHYDYHVDMFHTETTPVPACRKVSFSVWVDQMGKDYEGGDLLFMGAPMEDRPNKGDITIFPAYLTHKVTPVTKGQRNVIVGWIHGNSFR